MKNSETIPKRQIGAMELLGICGFAFFFGWMLVSFYWLFAVFLQDIPIAERDGAQLFVFAGMTLGYFVLHLVSKNTRFNLLTPPYMVVEAALALLLPLAALILSFDISLTLPLLCTVNLLTGLGGAAITVSWLDVGSRIRLRSFERFTSFSLLGGGLLFVLVALMPRSMQPVFCILYALASIGLLAFSAARANNNVEAPPLGSCKDTWTFTKEVEPSLAAFGIVFGLTFVYLFNSGVESVFIGLIFVILGADIVAVCALKKKTFSITLIQRVLLCVTVLACLLIPFASSGIQLACSCLVVASWAVFMSVNYALVLKKCVEHWESPVFRQVPVRLVFSALGFFLGWSIATAATMYFGAHTEAFTVVRLTMAFILVAVVMLFFPVSRHHDEDAAGESSVSAPVLTLNLSNTELFDKRCAAVAELYQLSPRETDILKFLAKGRNAGYIQNKLTISPHTVKSHIYNIYRKLDIHSQQKLMDFIEEYPVENEG